MRGVFCANFVTPRLHWEPCRSVWHGRCYTPPPDERFYYNVVADGDGFDWRPPEAVSRYKEGRDGDHLLTTFQCNLCCFRKQRRDPIPSFPPDDLLLCAIRRANLDAMWGREPHTVNATLRAAKGMIVQWSKVGLAPQFPPLGPFPVCDSLGMAVAIAMLMKSLEPGRYNTSYQQFETIRKLRAGFLNIYMASQDGVSSLRTVGGDKVKHHLTYSPTQSKWFEMFSQGYVRRMGQDVRQDWAIPLPAVHALLNILENEWRTTDSEASREKIASLGAFAVIGFCGSFRGSEVFLTDLHGLRTFLKDTERLGRDHVVVPLLGRFKGEQNSRYHLSPMANVTSSGIPILRWIKRLVEVREREGRLHGPAFCNRAGGIAKSFDYEADFIDRLMEIQAVNPVAVPPDVDVAEQFGVSRSFRRGATSVARARGIDDKYVTLINRWRTVENSRGKKPSLPMHEHYSDISILVPEMVKFSYGL